MLKSCLHFVILALQLLVLASSAQSLASVAPLGDRAIAPQRLLEISQSAQWRSLLFYRERLFGPPDSLFDSPLFFFSPQGHKDPLAELKETLRVMALPMAGFADAGEAYMHPQCRQPARWVFLKQQLGEELVGEDVYCESLETWFKMHQYDRVALVFSAKYPANPASMFGHTFVRLYRSDRKAPLLDGVINFAAQTPPDVNGWSYAFKGLTGGYPGMFSMVPYYAKLQEYSYVEHRDLWEYELNFSPEQIDFMLRVLWGLGGMEADYYYFDENCSLILLMLLETLDGDIRLQSQKPWIIPSDTVRQVAAVPGLVSGVHYQPSTVAALSQRFRGLPEQQQQWFDRPLADWQADWRQRIEGLSDRQQADLIDTLVDYIDFENRTWGSVELARHAQLRKDLLQYRRLLASTARPLTRYPRREQPHRGHDSSRFKVGAGGVEGEPWVSLRWRAALHDPWSPAEGYGADLGIGFFDLGLEQIYQEQGEYTGIDSFSLLAIQSFSQLPGFIKPWSWYVDVGYETFAECRQPSCGDSGLSGGVGTAWRVGRGLYYLLGSAQALYSRDEQARLGPGFVLGCYLEPLGPQQLGLAIHYNQHLIQERWRQEIEVRLNWSVSSQQSVFVEAQQQDEIARWQLGWFHYL